MESEAVKSSDGPQTSSTFVDPPNETNGPHLPVKRNSICPDHSPTTANVFTVINPAPQSFETIQRFSYDETFNDDSAEICDQKSGRTNGTRCSFDSINTSVDNESISNANTSSTTVSVQPDKKSLSLRVVDVWTKYPKLSLIASCVLMLVPWITTGILYATGYNIFPIDFEYLPVKIPESPWSERYLAFDFRRWNVANISNADVNVNYRTDVSFLGWFQIELLYYSKDNIMTQNNLAAVKKFENGLVNLTRGMYSVMRVIPEDAFLDNQAAASLILYVRSNDSLAPLLKYVLPKDYEIREKPLFVVSKILRTVILPRYRMGLDNKNNLLLKYLHTYSDKNSIGGDVEFSYWGRVLIEVDIAIQGIHDSLYAVGSFCFILLVLLIHTRSTVLTGATLFGILTSIISANLIYRVVFGRQYIGVFHSVAVFVTLGIGADDLFIMHDVWCDSFAMSFPSTAHRLKWVLGRAALTMLITSLTSALAFFVNTFCNSPMISTFGLFTGLAVTMNYFIVISFLPCVLINLDGFFSACQSNSKSCCRCRCCWPSWRRTTTQKLSKTSIRATAKFFGETLAPVLRRRIAQVISLCLCGGLMIYFITRASEFSASKSTALKLFLPGSNYDRAEKIITEMKHTDHIQVSMVWGLNHRDRSQCRKDDFRCIGETSFDNNFDLNSDAAQIALLDFCKRLRIDDQLQKRLRILKKNGVAEIPCFIEDMQRDMKYIKDRETVKCTDGQPMTDLTLPINKAKISRLMDCRPDLYGNPSMKRAIGFGKEFDRYFETALIFWLRNAEPGIHVSNDSNVKFYSVKELMTTWVLSVFKERWRLPHGGLYFGGRLRYAVINAKTTLTSRSDSFFTGSLVRDAWEDFMKESLSKFPDGLKSGFQDTMQTTSRSIFNLWEWYEIQEALWINARNGILIGLFAVALPILLVATGNFILTGFALLCLSCTLTAAIAIGVSMGWELGVSESINLALVTGLSVDYIVHFIEAYHLSKEATRDKKVQDMLESVGGAVMSGAVTTIGATVFLFMSKLLFFIQFGTFMCVSIGFSFFFSIFLLTPLLYLIGPEGQTASVKVCLVRLRDRLRKTGGDGNGETMVSHQRFANARESVVSETGISVVCSVEKEDSPSSHEDTVIT